MCPFLPKVFEDDGDIGEDNTGVINPPNSPMSESESSGSTDGSSDSSSGDECETDDENPLGGMLAKIEKEEKGEGEDDDEEEKVENEKGEDEEEDGEEEEEDDEEEDDDEGENWSSEVGHLVGNSLEEFGEVTLDSNFDIPPIPVGESSPQTVPNRFSIEDSDAEDSDLSDCSTFSIYEQNSHHEPMEVSKTAPPIENFPNMMEVDLKSLSNEEIEVGMVQVGLQSLPHKELEGNSMQVIFEPSPNIEIESDPEIINVEPDNMVEEQEINNVESVPSVEIEPETSNVEPENMNVNKIARAKPIPKQVDPEELVLAESRRKSLRSANVPAPVAAVNKRKRPSSANPKPKKKVPRSLVASAVKRLRRAIAKNIKLVEPNASKVKMARPIVMTDYFRQVSATLVRHRISNSDFLSVRQCLDQLVDITIGKTNSQNK